MGVFPRRTVCSTTSKANHPRAFIEYLTDRIENAYTPSLRKTYGTTADFLGLFRNRTGTRLYVISENAFHYSSSGDPASSLLKRLTDKRRGEQTSPLNSRIIYAGKICTYVRRPVTVRS